MKPKCKVCKDPRRAEIEKEMSRPRSDLPTARKFGISRPTIVKHRAHIVHRAPIEAPPEPNSSEISRLKARVQAIIDTTDDEKVQIAAARELRGYLELEARLAQEASGSASLTADPAFQRLAAALAKVLCPDCMSQVGDMTEDCLRMAAPAAQVPDSIEGDDAGDGGIPAPDEEGGGGRSSPTEPPSF